MNPSPRGGLCPMAPTPLPSPPLGEGGYDALKLGNRLTLSRTATPKCERRLGGRVPGRYWRKHRARR